MYYLVKTEDKYAFELEKFKTEEEAKEAFKNSYWAYDYQAIIKGEIITEIEI